MGRIRALFGAALLMSLTLAGGSAALAKASVHPKVTKVAAKAAKGKAAAKVSASTAKANTYAHFLSVNAKAHKATFVLVASYNNAGGGFNFDGGVNGHPVLRVPVGWTLTVAFRNAGSIPHSAAVVAGTSTKPAYPGATTPNPIHGTPPRGHASFTFRVTHAGTYRIACLVPGHEDAGMWMTFIATKGGVPTITP